MKIYGRIISSVVTFTSFILLCGCGGGSGGSGGGGVGGSSSSQTFSGHVTTFAGEAGNIGSNDAVNGPNAPASFNGPNGITSDGTNLYVTDSGSNTIRKIVIATGAVTTLAGTAGIKGSADATGSVASFNFPTGITTDGTNLYVTDSGNNTIRQIVIATGAVTTLAGTTGTSGSTDAPSGPGTSASFNNPLGITIDKTGTNLYVADSGNSTIRKIVIASGVVSTLAGTAGTPGSADAPNGPGTAASFNGPFDITTDGTNLYVPDYKNNTIRQIVIATGAVTTLAGTAGTTGSTDAPTGPGTAATFNGPDSITTDGTNLYVSDAGNNTIRKIVIASGAVTTLAGTAETTGGSTDAPTGPGSAASFNNPSCLAIVGANLYIADNGNDTIRQIVISSGAVTTLAGTAGTAGSVDNTASFHYPTGIATDGTNFYVADTFNNTIRQVVIASGVVTTLAGTAGTPGSTDAPSGPGTSALFNNPLGITTDGTNLYVADYGNNTIREISIATGHVTTLAGTAGTPGSTNGTGGAALFNGPSDITTDGTNLYVSDYISNTIRKIVISTGAVTTLAGTAGTTGSTNGTGAAALFNGPDGITTDGTNLYVSDAKNNTIRKIVIASGVVTTLAGTGTAGSTNGTGSAASFNNPSCLTTDGTNLYVADYSNNTIREIVIATGAVTTLAGTPLTPGSTDAPNGPGSVANFNGPNGITTDGVSLYVTDSNNNTIRKIR